MWRWWAWAGGWGRVSYIDENESNQNESWLTVEEKSDLQWWCRLTCFSHNSFSTFLPPFHLFSLLLFCTSVLVLLLFSAFSTLCSPTFCSKCLRPSPKVFTALTPLDSNTCFCCYGTGGMEIIVLDFISKCWHIQPHFDIAGSTKTLVLTRYCKMLLGRCRRCWVSTRGSQRGYFCIITLATCWWLCRQRRKCPIDHIVASWQRSSKEARCSTHDTVSVVAASIRSNRAVLICVVVSRSSFSFPPSLLLLWTVTRQVSWIIDELMKRR